jgi:succinate dehydrogenase / fumarate reductase membrane anchor subunit
MSRPTHGLRDWMLQRLSAVYLGVFLAYLVVHFYLQPQQSYQEWHDWVTRPVMSVASAVFILAILVHGWVGMRDVVLDYIHNLGLRIIVLSLTGLGLIGCGLWAMQILLLASG